jgi:regulator of sigma E protease
MLPRDFAKQYASAQKIDFLSPRFAFTVGDIVSGFPAEKAGIQKGDVLLRIDSSPVLFFDQLQLALKAVGGKQAQVTLLRGSDTLNIPVEVTADGKIGFSPIPQELAYDSVKFSLLQSFPKGVDKAVETISMQVKGWGKIFSGDIPANKAVTGPIGIAKFYGGEWIWSRFWLFTALISLGLAFMNILPIPALDGGHVVLLLIEMITGKPISTKAMERVQTVGMVILLSLMVLIFGNDLIGLFLK